MTSTEATIAVIDALNELAIPYMLVGSNASNYHSIPRSTKDADIVLHLGEQSIHSIARRLGAAFRLDPQMQFETVTMTRKFVISVVGIPFEIEFFLLSDDAHDQERFRRRIHVRHLDRDVYLASLEDMVITKLRWWNRQRRNKDSDDARNLIAANAERIDWNYVYHWCDIHGTRADLDQIRASIPPL